MSRSSINFSLARSLILLSLVLLAVVEYLWLRNEYTTRHGDMETRLSHAMFTAIRDVEDSLIFTTLADPAAFLARDSGGIVSISIDVERESTTAGRGDSLFVSKDVVEIQGSDRNRSSFRHPMRGLLLKRMLQDSHRCDSGKAAFPSLLMHRIRLADTTGAADGYHIVTWVHDTVIDEAVSRPARDFLTGHKMALANRDYRADLWHEMIPLFGFALLMWLVVAAAFYYIWQSLRRQLALHALRDEFVSNITHELKTPITTVGVALESMAQSGELTGVNSKAYLDISRNELNRLTMLVERILHHKTPELQYERLDVREVMEEVLHQMQVQFDKRGARVSLTAEGPGFVIRGDRTHMSSVLYNLLDNALKYSPRSPEIRVHLMRENGTVTLHIADQGVGIDPVYHDRIFEKLFRAPSHNRHDVKGHGLGLSYVADVVKKHDGEVRVASAPGSGSTFTLTFPALHEN